MSPVIDASELRLLQIAYRRAHGSTDMPTSEFLDELTQELKDQAASNADLRMSLSFSLNITRVPTQITRHLTPAWSPPMMKRRATGLPVHRGRFRR